MAQHYEFAVVGAGIEGSWTALQAVRRSKSVVLLDQFPLPHSRGSSHGQSRIIRHAYAERFHAELMPRAFTQWRQLERDTGRHLLVDTPLLCIADETGYTSLQSTLDSLRHVLPNGEGSQYRQLNAEELRREFPQATFTDKHRGVLEKCAGILHADRCLEAVQSQFVSLGGTLKDGTLVTSLRKDGSRVRVDLSGQGDYITADKVAVCAGPWTAKLLDPLLPKKLPLTPLRVNVYYWRIKRDGPGAIKTSYIDLGDGHEFWGIPEFEYPGLVKYLHPTYLHSDPESRDLGRGKMCDAEQLELHEIKEHISKLFPGIDVTEPAIVETCMYTLCSHMEYSSDPDDRDKMAPPGKTNRISNYINKRFPGLEQEPSIVETCMYTMTPDEISIIDHVPYCKNIVYACGFSGTGFKKAPEVGRILVQMLTSSKTDYDLTPFALSRFDKTSAKL